MRLERRTRLHDCGADPMTLLNSIGTVDGFYIGVSANGLKPRDKVRQSHVEQILADQAQTYSRLTGFEADGATQQFVNGYGSFHNHSSYDGITQYLSDYQGEGNRLYWPFFSQQFSTGSIRSYDPTSIPPAVVTSFGDTPVIKSGGVDLADAPIFYCPTYIDPVWSYHPLLIVVEAYSMGGNAPLYCQPIVVGSPSDFSLGTGYNQTTATGAQQKFQLDKVSEYASGVLETSAAKTELYSGLWLDDGTGLKETIFRISSDLVADGGGVTAIKSITIIPSIPAFNSLPSVTPVPSGSNVVTVGDAYGSNGWTPPDSLLVGDDAPLGPALEIANANSAFLFEVATGQRAPGNVSATVSGHNHSSDAPSNSGVFPAMVFGAWTFGTFLDNSGLGGRILAPKVGNASTANTFYPLGEVALMVPDGVTSISGYCVIYREDSKGETVTVRLENVTATSTYDGVSATGTSSANRNIESVSLGAVSATAGTRNVFRVHMKNNIVPTNGYEPALLGLCLYQAAITS